MSLTDFSLEDAPEITDRLRDVSESLLSTLSAFHRGRGRAVKAAALCKAFSISRQELCTCIHYLRGFELVGSGGRGYYFPETVEEVERTLAHLRERHRALTRVIESQERLLKNMKQKERPALDKQQGKCYIRT